MRRRCTLQWSSAPELPPHPLQCPPNAFEWLQIGRRTGSDLAPIVSAARAYAATMYSAMVFGSGIASPSSAMPAKCIRMATDRKKNGKRSSADRQRGAGLCGDDVLCNGLRLRNCLPILCNARQMHSNGSADKAGGFLERSSSSHAPWQIRHEIGRASCRERV